ncbi:MAG: hypothetical protein ABI878_04845 [Acidobacteriota bacterium]
MIDPQLLAGATFVPGRSGQAGRRDKIISRTRSSNLQNAAHAAKMSDFMQDRKSVYSGRRSSKTGLLSLIGSMACYFKRFL